MRVIWIGIIFLFLSIDGGTTSNYSRRSDTRDSMVRLHELFMEETKKRLEEEEQRLYKERMATLESGGDYTVVNRLGYMGKYQFGKKTLRGLMRTGYLETVGLKNFTKNVELQERAMDALIQHNLDYIKRNDLDKYVGRRIGGVKITLNGMLAGSHLVGPYAVKRYLKTNGRVIKKDANGTSVVDYLSEFENG